ncbi:response regulator transcription factor [Actinoalloteichus sp. GBA129-24]|uniref:response regulator transcription factor n=1 Tax=Actinoalloteichus sp. GBA129-24 TaxID=1612551 RepID=UPI0009506826|nr:helix-turn-helix transcriptional regulator [Actinoalloteichus sp. GBA129-24]APU20967.1 DNA-binding protein with HTH domain [Actinoalloteichus sp. GBA129-24]APU24216.1 DNA-binding protein with HTH domain [Actinoalloteichus sp. GBA129-24]
MTAVMPRRWPTPTEARVLARLARGMAPAAIADDLGMPTRTVESHLRHARERLGLDRRAELRTWAAAHAPELPDA